MIVGDNIKLLDFGVARTVSAAANKSLSVMLKPGYAPEEQYRSKGVQGPWTDVYALCSTMYKCITGVTPDDATQRVFSDDVKTPSALGIAVSPEIETAIMRGMSVLQQDRYQSIDDLLKGLQGIKVNNSDFDHTINARKKVVEDDVETCYVDSIEANTIIGEDNIRTEYNSINSDYEKTVLDTSYRKTSNTLIENNNGNFNNNYVEANNRSAAKRSNILPVVIVCITVVIALIIVAITVITVFKNKSSDSDNTNVTEAIAEVTETVSETDTTEPEVTESVSEDNLAESQRSDDEEIKMSDDLFDFTFKLEGDVYQLPCSIQKFKNNGWTFLENDASEDTVINGNSSVSYYMIKDGKRNTKIYLYSYNKSGNAKRISECNVGGINIDNSKIDFSIAKGISVKSSINVIKDAFGTPHQNSKSDTSEALLYFADSSESSDRSVYFPYYSELKKIGILIKNFVETESDLTETNYEVPEYLSEYIAPKELSDHISSGIISLEGDFYDFPAPLSEYIDNGWEIVQRPGSIVSGGTEYLTLERDGKRISVTICNYADYQTVPENCAVYEVLFDTAYNTDNQIEMILSGNEDNRIALGSKKNDTFEERFDIDEYDTFTIYSFTDDGKLTGRDMELRITVDNETEIVTKISIKCKTWYWYLFIN